MTWEMWVGLAWLISLQVSYAALAYQSRKQWKSLLSVTVLLAALAGVDPEKIENAVRGKKR